MSASKLEDKTKKRIQPVIMAGGQGKRLWPISKPDSPKQFHKFDQNFSPLQNTIIRNSHFGKPIIIINARHKEIALQQIDEIRAECEIIIELNGKGTAICSILAAFAAKESQSCCTLLIPADHQINGTQNYIRTVNKAANIIEQSSLVTIGITPTCASQEYGYIRRGKNFSQSAYECEEFVEKPNKDEANRYLNEKNFLWNSGIFLYCPDQFLSIANKLEPSMLKAAQAIWHNRSTQKNLTYLGSNPEYDGTQSNTIDYCFAEKLKKIKVVLGEFEWSDLGTLANLFELMEKDENNNYLSKNSFISSDVKNCYIMHDKKIALVIGLENIVLVSDKEHLLISSMEKTSELKTIINRLKINNVEL